MDQKVTIETTYNRNEVMKPNERPTIVLDGPVSRKERKIIIVVVFRQTREFMITGRIPS